MISAILSFANAHPIFFNLYAFVAALLIFALLVAIFEKRELKRPVNPLDPGYRGRR